MEKALPIGICSFVLMASLSQSGHTLTAEEADILASWLANQAGLRAATSADCACSEDIEQMRKGFGGQWAPIRDYVPYVATGDFNGDHQRDFAVVVIDKSRPPERSFTLVVFNGPFESAKASPAFVRHELDMRGRGLFFGAPRPRPYRLVVGAFESEGAILQPLGSSYRLTFE